MYKSYVYVRVYGTFVAVPLNREQIFDMCGIFTHGREPVDKATLMCVCILALLDPSVFAHVNCMHVYMVIVMCPLFTCIHKERECLTSVYVEGI